MLVLLVAVVVAVAVTGGRIVGGGFARGALAGGLVGTVAVVAVTGLLIKRAETRANRE
jgi:hypothetical protein